MGAHHKRRYIVSDCVSIRRYADCDVEFTQVKSQFNIAGVVKHPFDVLYFIELIGEAYEKARSSLLNVRQHSSNEMHLPRETLQRRAEKTWA